NAKPRASRASRGVGTAHASGSGSARRSGSGSARTSGSGRTRASASGRSRASGKSRASSSPRAARPAASSGSSMTARATVGVADGLASLAEQLANRIIRPLGLVVLSRERIQETLDEAAEGGRITRSDANELVSELVHRGREQTEELLSDTERLLGLRGLRDYERRHANRKSVLSAIGKALG